MNLPLQPKFRSMSQSRSVAALHQSVYTAQNLSYPQQVDFARLSQDEAEEIEFYMNKIDNFEREHKDMQTHSIKLLQNTYHKQKRIIELEEFFKQCIVACEKEIMKSHEMSQLSSKNKVSSSFFFELKRKKFMQEIVKQPQGSNNL